ncbi:hypothetical protein [Zestomonas thermotolerans]|jgi:hypothetical protein|nr:hypothetical protein [Pseudomonas thermotolerans]
MRVLANGEGCDLVFTLFRQPDMDDAGFAADWVRRNLETLRTPLEGR